MGILREQTISQNSGARATVKALLQALLIAVLVRTLLFQPFNIPSGSLVPTLLTGDDLFVAKYAYGYSRYALPFGLPIFSGRIFGFEPKRGDVVVFKLPKSNSLDYIKRVIGLPGDRIQMIHGVLHINGQPVQRERVENYNTTDFYGRSVAVPQYIETLPNGVKYRTIETDGDRGVWDDTRVYTVPAGDFFMMGDNRDDSDDSRDQFNVGYVPFENLVGKAGIIYFSVEENATLWRPWDWLGMVRWGRLLQHVG
jgi:signal peptidase I